LGGQFLARSNVHAVPVALAMPQAMMTFIMPA